MNNKEFKQTWEEMESKEPLTPVINPQGQRSLEECQDLDRGAILQRIDTINQEIRVLENRVKFHATGHIKTTISVMKARKREIERRLQGDPEWFDEYLIGY